mgnify:FL=1
MVEIKNLNLVIQEEHLNIPQMADTILLHKSEHKPVAWLTQFVVIFIMYLIEEKLTVLCLLVHY